MRAGKHRRRGGTELVWLILALALAAAAFTVSDAGAAGVDAGGAEIVDPSGVGAGEPITEGGSATEFTLRLPEAAACTGDSANDGFRVSGFMVPSDTDLSTLNFGSQGPASDPVDPDFHPLRRHTGGSAFANAQTANASPPGGPGPIINIPAFSYVAFDAGEIAEGTYAIGIYCHRVAQGPTQPDKFWEVFIEVTADENDEPAGFTWAVAEEPPPSSSTTTTSAAGTTTTSGGGTTTTTSSGGTTTTSTTAGSTDTTDPGNPQVLGSGASNSGSGSSSSGVPGGQLPQSGSTPLPQILWAFSFVCVGRALMLIVKRPVVRVRAGH